MSSQQASLTEQEKIKHLITTYPLATIIIQSQNNLQAHHIPMHLVTTSEGNTVLQGHIARANPMWKTKPHSALVLFHGPDTYITPSYYPSKAVNGRAVPTWNYVAVHIQGSIRFVDDAKWCLQAVSHLSNMMETSRTQPWSIDDAPEDYLNQLIQAVIGLEITLDACTLKAKVSRNQTTENRQGVIDGLRTDSTSSHAQVMADWIANR